MHISNNKYRVVQITEKNMAESAQLLAYSFITENPTWKTLSPDYSDVLSFMNAKLREMVQWQNQLRAQGVIDTPINFAYVDDKEEVVGVFTGIEMTQYLSRNSKVNLKEFDVLQKYGHQLQESLLEKDKIPGIAVYGMFFTIKRSQMGTNLKYLFFFDVSHYLHTKGFRYFISRYSNIKSKKIATHRGGYLTAHIRTIENGGQINLYFVKWYFDPLQRTKHYFQKYIEKANL